MEKSIQIKLAMGILLAATFYLMIFGVLYLVAGRFQTYHTSFTGILFTVITDIITFPIFGTHALTIYIANIAFLILNSIAWIITGRELLSK